MLPFIVCFLALIFDYDLLATISILTVAAGGVVETVIVTGVGTDHVNGGTLLNGILHLTL